MNARSLFNKIIVNNTEIDIDALDANNGIYQLPAGQKIAKVKFKLKDKTTLPDVFYLNSQVKKIKMPEAMVNIPDHSLYGTGIIQEEQSYFTYFNQKAFTKRPIDLDDQYFGFSANSIEVVDDNPEFPTFTNTNSFTVVFSSSDETVATINSQGVVTIVGNGTTLIKATFAGNETYKTKEAFYTLVVNKPKQNIADEDFGYSIENVTITEANQNLPTLTNVNSLPVEFTSSDETVATVNDQGIVTIIKNGTTIIKATYKGNINYNGKEDSYTLIVNIPVPKQNIDNDAFKYSAESITITEDGQQLPTLTNTNSLEVIYASSNTSVATINNQGEVSIVGNGTTTISATFEGNEQYNEKVASYTLVVNLPQVLKTWYLGSATQEQVTSQEYINSVELNQVEKPTDRIQLYGGSGVYTLILIPTSWGIPTIADDQGFAFLKTPYDLADLEVENPEGMTILVYECGADMLEYIKWE